MGVGGRHGFFTFGDTRRYAALGAQARAEAWTGGHVAAGQAARSHLDHAILAVPERSIVLRLPPQHAQVHRKEAVQA